jgi:phage gp29-like protein
MKKAKKELLDNSIIERLHDDELVGMMHELPDTDELLRKAGVDQEVYNEILQDPHVMGEVRQIYSSLLGFKYELQAGDESNSAQQALELCQSIFKKRPHRTMRWNDLFWSIGKAPLTGRRVHGIKWQEKNGKLIPAQIKDIEAQKYGFNHEGELLIKTMAIPQGEVAPDMLFLVTRHMADATNPYGLAILSCCFWSWMFKNGGLKFFVRFCERFGQPFPIGKYPVGTQDSDIDILIKSLQQLAEDAVAAIPDDSSIDLLEVKTSGQLPQERLVLLMNREMSKALTSQTAASELTGGDGSRAASQTHQGRTDQNAKADRSLVADTANQLFEFITIVNFGEDVPPPTLKYIDKKQISKDDVEITVQTAKAAPIKADELYSRTGFTKPAEGDETIFLGADFGKEPGKGAVAEFSKGNDSNTDEFTDIEQSISDIIDQIKAAIAKGETLEDALEAIVALVPELDKEVLTDLVSQELEVEFGKGMMEAK